MLLQSFFLMRAIMSFIFFGNPLPETNAHLRVTYDLFGNSFDLSTLPGTKFTKEELQTLVAVNLGLISTSLNEKDLDLAKKGIKILTIADSPLNDKDAYVFEQGATNVRVVLDKGVFPESPPATLACEKERESRRREEDVERTRSLFTKTLLDLENAFCLAGLDASSRFEKIKKEPNLSMQLSALKEEFKLLDAHLKKMPHSFSKFRRDISRVMHPPG